VGGRRKHFVPAREHVNVRRPAVFCALICVFLAIPCLRAQDDEKAFADVEGRVVNASTGEPMHKALVWLSRRQAKSDVKLIGSTDPEGKFRFKRVRPGDYTLAAQRNGFLERRHDSVLALKANDHLKDIVLRLSPAGAISGKVIDEDGDPVAGAEVRLWYRTNYFGQDRLERYGGAAYQTNGNGEYRFDGLAPGSYFVRATPNNGVETSLDDQFVNSNGDPILLRDVATYYPGALFVDNASPIRVSGGEEQGGTDVRLRRSKAFRISGNVVGFEPATPPDLKVFISRVEKGTYWLVGDVAVSSNGGFAVNKLLPGTYELSLHRTGTNVRGKTLVAVTSTDVTEVTITPYVPAQVKLRVAVEGDGRTTPLAGIAHLRRNPLDYGAWCHFEDGVCDLRDVEPGKHLLDIRTSADGYIKSVRSGERRFSPRAIDVPEGGLALDAILSRAMAQIDGQIEEEGQNKSLVGVVLVPVTTGEEIADLPRMTSLDQHGHFSFLNLPPGKYRLFAAEEVQYAQWSNPDLVRELESKGTALELQERESLRVQLKPISKQEVSKTREKLGLE
jgi:hypothetical protein